MMPPFAQNMEWGEALRAFLAGFTGSQLDTPPTIYRSASTERGGELLLYPLSPLNGSVIFRRIPDYLLVIRANVTTQTTEHVIQGLQELTRHLENFLAGLNRPARHTRNPDQYYDWQASAIVGFGTTFFTDPQTGASRFSFVTTPRELDFLRLEGDAEAGLEAVVSQADLFISIEAVNNSLLLDGYEYLVRYFETTNWIKLKDAHQGATRGDGRNHFGFYDGVRNPTLESQPSAQEVALTRPPDEDAALSGGSYLAFKKYSFDMKKWGDFEVSKQEAITGIRKATGEYPSPLHTDSHVERARAAGDLSIYRRGISYAEIGEPVDRGLLFISFQKNPRQFTRLHSALFGASVTRHPNLLSGELVRPLTADLYFTPDYFGWGYIGQVFFEPEAFRSYYLGREQLGNAEFLEASRTFRELIENRPDFLPSYEGLSNATAELGQLNDATQIADEALRLDSNHYLILNAKARAEYLLGHYERAVVFARQALESIRANSLRALPYQILGSALLELGRPVEAEANLQRALERVNTEPAAWYSLGNALFGQERFEVAAQMYQRSLETVKHRLRADLISRLDRKNLCRISDIHFKSHLGQKTQEQIAQLLRR